MFAAVILVCGLEANMNPMIVESCGVIFGNRPFVTEDECRKSLAFATDNLSLPPKAYVSDTKCIPLDTQT